MKTAQARVSVCALTLAGIGAAQVPLTASPKEFVPSTRPEGIFAPFNDSPHTFQQVHGASSFTSNAPAMFRELWFVARHGYQNTEVWLDLELFVALAPSDALGAKSVLAANVLPATEVNVFTRKQVQIRAYQASDYRVVFDTPFAWNGSHLSWRLNCYTPGTARTYVLVSGTGLQTISQGGVTSCYAVSTGWVGLPGSVAILGAQKSWPYQKGTPGALVLGQTLASVPLALYGAPGCLMLDSPLITGKESMNDDGQIFFTLPIPNQLWLAGFTFAHQVAFLIPGANALGVTTSSLCPDMVQRRFDVASIANDSVANASLGTLSTHVAAYVAFY